MEKKKKVAAKIPGIAARIFDLLEPLSPEDRQKSISAAMVMLGTAIDMAPGMPPGPGKPPGTGRT